MKPIHFTHNENSDPAYQTVVMDNGTVWIRCRSPYKNSHSWERWQRVVNLPTERDFLDSENPKPQVEG